MYALHRDLFATLAFRHDCNYGSVLVEQPFAGEKSVIRFLTAMDDTYSTSMSFGISLCSVCYMWMSISLRQATVLFSLPGPMF